MSEWIAVVLVSAGMVVMMARNLLVLRFLHEEGGICKTLMSRYVLGNLLGISKPVTWLKKFLNYEE